MVRCCNTTLKQIIYSWCQIIVGQKLVSKVNSFVKQKYNPQLKCPKITGNIDEDVFDCHCTPPPFSPVKTSKLRRNSPRHRDHSIEKFATLTEFGSNEDAPQATSLAKNSGENWNGIVQSDCSKFWRICCCGFQNGAKSEAQDGPTTYNSLKLNPTKC